MPNVGRDRLANEEAQGFSNSFHLSRVAPNKTSDFVGQGRDLEALREVNGDRRVESPRDASRLAPSSLVDMSAPRRVRPGAGYAYLRDRRASGGDRSTSRIREGVDPETQAIILAVEQGEKQVLAVVLLHDGRRKRETTCIRPLRKRIFGRYAQTYLGA